MMSAKLPITIDSLEPVARVGAGGFGQVWKAEQPSLDRTVAIKVGHSPIVDAADRRRFERECKALGRLSSNPGVLDVYMSGISDCGFPYLVTEYIEGGTLENFSREVSEPWLIQVGIELCSSIAVAHSNNVLHRDLKPGNVLLRADGSAVVGDFGLAKLADKSGTTSSEVMATLAYASPEVLDGGVATIRSDVYGIAVTIASVILGDSPFVSQGDNSAAAMVNRILNEPPSALQRASISPEFADLLIETMAKDPNDRPTNALELENRFRELLPVEKTERDLEPVVGADASAGGERVDSSRWKLRGSLLVGLALVCLSTVIWVSGRTDGPSPIAADASTPEISVESTALASPTTTPGASGPDSTSEPAPVDFPKGDEREAESRNPDGSSPAEGPPATSGMPSTEAPEDKGPSSTSAERPSDVGPTAQRKFQTGSRSGLVTFEPGESSSVVHGLLDSGSLHVYKMDAKKGQKLGVSFVQTEGNADIRYRVFSPAGDQMIVKRKSATGGLVLPADGQYRVEVFVVNGQDGNYHLNISLK